MSGNLHSVTHQTYYNASTAHIKENVFAVVKLQGIVVLFRWMSFAKIKSLNLVFQHNLWHQSITHRVELCFPNGRSVDTELNIHFDCTVSCVEASIAVMFSIFKDLTGQREACGYRDWACCTMDSLDGLNLICPSHPCCQRRREKESLP